MARRKSTKAVETEAKVQKALAGLADGTYTNACEAANTLQLSYATLRRRTNGGRSRAEGREIVQNLSIPEEKALQQWITHLTVAGNPIRHSVLAAMADEIRNRRVVKINDSMIQLVFYPPTSHSWVQRFMQRHPQLGTTLSRMIETSRLKEASEDAIQQWFTVFAKEMEENQISIGNIYNVDETGNSLGTMERAHVVVDTTQNTQYQGQPGRQEWITAVECICADGTSISPLIIFKGESLLSGWVPPNEAADWQFVSNSKGWTSNDIGLQWLRKVFELQTRDKACGKMRVLICDGHDSHISGDFIRHCIQCDIILLLLPPHSSHLTQPLDVGVFGPLKKAISASVSQLIQTGISRMQKFEWVQHYSKARSTAIRPGNIYGGWRGAGLFPMDPSRVLRHIAVQATSTPPLPAANQFNHETPFENSLITSSPPDAIVLQSANHALNELIGVRPEIPSPVQGYVRRLTHTTERLHAENSILKYNYQELHTVVSARKERLTGKKVVLKGRNLVSTEKIHKAVVECELATAIK